GSFPRESWGALNLPSTAKMMDGITVPEQLPSWISEEELAYYVGEFERNGFRGPLNWYRNFDRNWELTAGFGDLRIKVPALFIGGLSDGVVTGMGLTPDGESPAVQAMPSFFDDFRGK